MRGKKKPFFFKDDSALARKGSKVQEFISKNILEENIVVPKDGLGQQDAKDHEGDASSPNAPSISVEKHVRTLVWVSVSAEGND